MQSRIPQRGESCTGSWCMNYHKLTGLKASKGSCQRLCEMQIRRRGHRHFLSNLQALLQCLKWKLQCRVQQVEVFVLEFWGAVVSRCFSCPNSISQILSDPTILPIALASSWCRTEICCNWQRELSAWTWCETRPAWECWNICIDGSFLELRAWVSLFAWVRRFKKTLGKSQLL